MLAVARDLAPATLLPFHWDFWRNHTGDIVALLELYFRDRPPFDLKVLLIGDSLTLTGRRSGPGMSLKRWRVLRHRGCGRFGRAWMCVALTRPERAVELSQPPFRFWFERLSRTNTSGSSTGRR